MVTKARTEADGMMGAQDVMQGLQARLNRGRSIRREHVKRTIFKDIDNILPTMTSGKLLIE